MPTHVAHTAAISASYPSKSNLSNATGLSGYQARVCLALLNRNPRECLDELARLSREMPSYDTKADLLFNFMKRGD